MTKVIQFHETGPARVLRYEDIDVGKPKRGEVRVRNAAIGLNFIDVYVRTGLYPTPDLPSGIGFEGAGTITAIGAGVSGLKPGDRIAYGVGPLGAYAEERILPADRVVKLPKEISEQTAAAMMLKGMTAHYLIRRIYKVKPGDIVLFHAAAGGVGLIACQWLKALGAKVIGTVGSDEKAKLAKRMGCTWPVNYRKENFVERVKEITRGKGVPAVYDSIGKATFTKSLDCLSPLGTMVSYGNASGPPDPISPMTLAQKGSLILTRPSLFHYVAARDDMLKASRELFKVVSSGAVNARIDQTYPLKDAAKAHRDLEGRKTTGSTILVP